MKKIQHIIEYGIILFFKIILNLLPEKWIPALVHFLTFFSFHIIPYRKHIILQNLKIAFPGKNESFYRKILKANYQHMILLILETILLFKWSDEKLLSMVNLDPILPTKKAVEKGAILLSGHLGNWEVFARALCLNGFPLAVIMKRQKNPYINRLIEKWRHSVHMKIIYTKGALKKSLHFLDKKYIITILGDQDARNKGIFSPFFGRRSSTHVGAAVMAYMKDVPVIFGVGIRDSIKKYHAEIELLDVQELKKKCGNDKDKFIQLFVDKYNQFLEQKIRTYPEQYFWSHKRWKTSHPDDEKIQYK